MEEILLENHVFLFLFLKEEGCKMKIKLNEKYKKMCSKKMYVYPDIWCSFLTLPNIKNENEIVGERRADSFMHVLV